MPWQRQSRQPVRAEVEWGESFDERLCATPGCRERTIVKFGLISAKFNSFRRPVRWTLAGGAAAALVAWSLSAIWAPSPINVLLITLDTTRADRLGCYGYAAGRTPQLDSLAEGGVLCERAITVAPLTLPAHVSLLTGLYPAESGVRTNGRGRLDDTIPTLAEVLKKRSYHTGAFVASFVLDSKFGLGRGFDVYDDDFRSEESDSNPLHRQRPGESVVDAALTWLRTPRRYPFFCWVHLYDPHEPYLTHPELFGTEFAEQPYDAEIAYVDRQVGRLLEHLRVSGSDSQTLVVVVGDHGEGLGEHLEETHGLTLYDASMRVPLIFRIPAHLPAGKRVSANISLVDVAPTILELTSNPGARTMTGKSLKSVLKGTANPISLCYGATDDPFLVNGWSPLRSLSHENWKYIRTTRVELYDLDADPHELQNLAESNPEQTREMESRMGEFESHLVMRDESKIQLSATDRRALASLGYLGAAATTTKEPVSANLPDVKEMLAFDLAIKEAGKLIGEGAIDEGINRLRIVVRKAPTFLNASWTLALALRNQGKAEQGLEVFREFVTNKPDSPHGHLGVALMLLSLNRAREAIPALRKAIEIDPELTDAHFNLAKALLSASDFNGALSHIEQVIALDPRNSDAYRYRAFLRGQLGRPEEAIADYQRALKYAPNSSEAHHNLGILLADSGRSDDALQHLVRSVELAPDRAEFHSALGRLLLRLGRYDQALISLNKSLELNPNFAPAKAGREEALRGLAGHKP